MTSIVLKIWEGVRQALKAAAGVLLGQYAFNRIYRLTSIAAKPSLPFGIDCHPLGEQPTSLAQIDPELRARFSYDGDDAYGFGLYVDGLLAAICWFWGSRRFNDPTLWVLQPSEAILVDLVTASRYRGQGLAPLLIRYASAEMVRNGWGPLYTWMWHTHSASYRAFENAGWGQTAWVLKIQPLGAARTCRFCWRSFRTGGGVNPN